MHRSYDVVNLYIQDTRHRTVETIQFDPTSPPPIHYADMIMLRGIECAIIAESAGGEDNSLEWFAVLPAQFADTRRRLIEQGILRPLQVVKVIDNYLN